MFGIFLQDCKKREEAFVYARETGIVQIVQILWSHCEVKPKSAIHLLISFDGLHLGTDISGNEQVAMEIITCSACSQRFYDKIEYGLDLSS